MKQYIFEAKAIPVGEAAIDQQPKWNIIESVIITISVMLIYMEAECSRML